uniref:Uncharacterized protein n=1 Tax=Cucumis melo TaxID=3656 RepID=A0A9I9EA40_CUCME
MVKVDVKKFDLAAAPRPVPVKDDSFSLKTPSSCRSSDPPIRSTTLSSSQSRRGADPTPSSALLRSAPVQLALHSYSDFCLASSDLICPTSSRQG